MKQKSKLVLFCTMVFALVSMFCTMVFAENGDTWTTKSSMTEAKYLHQTAVVNGKIYAIGGKNSNEVDEYNPSTDTWIAKAPMNEARYDFQVVVVDGKIYAIGGHNASATLNSVEVYDPTNNTWTTKAPMNEMRYDFQATVIDGKIFVTGGNNGSTTLSTVQEYNPANDTWTTKTPMKYPRSSHQVVIIDGKIYVMGGSNDSGILNTVEEYDHTNNTWTTKTPMHNAKNRYQVATINGKIYAIGGLTSAVSCIKTVEEYDPSTDIWTTKAPMNEARCYHQVAVVDGKIYAIGGQSITTTAPSTYLNSVEEYDPSTNKWTIIAPLNTQRRSHKVEVIDNKIYAIGGYNGTALNSVEMYTPAITTPSAPTNLTAAAGNAKVDLSWTGVDGATSYNIKRSTTSGGPYETIGTADGTATSYTDTTHDYNGKTYTVENGTTYYYVVSAVVSGVEGTDSNEASAMPEASTVTPGDGATLDITMVTGEIKEYSLTADELGAFLTWYDSRSGGAAKAYYIFNHKNNVSPYKTIKEYISYDKISSFEVKEY